MANKDNADEANFMSRMLTWDEVVKFAKQDGYEGDRKPGQIARYLAWRVFQRSQGRG